MSKIEITLPRVSDREEHNVLNYSFRDPEATPSWRRSGKGIRIMQATISRAGNHVSFNIAEHAPPEGDRKAVSRSTYMTLDEDAGRALYHALAEVYGSWPDKHVTDLEIQARKLPWTQIEAGTPADIVTVKFCRSFSSGNKFVYHHNGVQIERQRAVELLLHNGEL